MRDGWDGISATYPDQGWVIIIYAHIPVASLHVSDLPTAFLQANTSFTHQELGTGQWLQPRDWFQIGIQGRISTAHFLGCRPQRELNDMVGPFSHTKLNLQIHQINKAMVFSSILSTKHQRKTFLNWISGIVQHTTKANDYDVLVFAVVSRITPDPQRVVRTLWRNVS